MVGGVDVVPVDTVLEASAACADRARAEAALSASLAGMRAPRRADGHWRLLVQVSTVSPGVKSAEAQMRDDRGRLVAERVVRDKTTSCVAIARAIGAWAQVVLDEELARTEPEAPPPPPVVDEAPIVAPPSPRPSDADLEPRGAPATRTVELGTMLFLRNGAASTGGIFGVSPFLAYGRATWVLRVAAAVGTSTARVPPDASRSENLTYAGGRVDLCKRLPGNYIDRKGIEVDVCAGTDAAWVWSPLEARARWSAGPAAVIRGELGESVGLEVRTMVGANLLRSGGAGAVVVSGELGGSVRFR